MIDLFSLLGASEPVGVDDGPKCSRSGCDSRAEWNVNWRNPRIHGIERVKIWLACGTHQEYLRDYLATREFPVVVTPLGSPLTGWTPDPDSVGGE